MTFKFKSALAKVPGLRSAYYELARIARREPPVTPGEFDFNSLPELLRKQDPLILDIGAYDGVHSERFANMFSNARVCSFEPDPGAQARFRNQVRNPQVQLFELAISDRDGESQFNVSSGLPSEEWRDRFPEGWNCSGSLKAPKYHLEAYPWCKFEGQLAVRTSRLDTWRKEQGIDIVDFIWADVQGAEEDLIKGGSETLARTRYFYTEYYNCEMYEGQQPLHVLLAMLPNFEVVVRYASDVLLRNKHLTSANIDSSRLSTV